MYLLLAASMGGYTAQKPANRPLDDILLKSREPVQGMAPCQYGIELTFIALVEV